MTIPDNLKRILNKKGFAHVATIGPDGEPQNNPVWFKWDGEHLLISQTDEKQKFKNMQREPRVAVSISDPDDPYKRVELRGHVARVDTDADRSFIDMLAKSYTGKDHYEYDPPNTARYIVAIEPEHYTKYGD